MALNRHKSFEHIELRTQHKKAIFPFHNSSYSGQIAESQTVLYYKSIHPSLFWYIDRTRSEKACKEKKVLKKNTAQITQ